VHLIADPNGPDVGAVNPGEVAATAGTSGVVYGVDREPVFDLKSRVNTFVHVNHRQEDPRYGVLLCVNGTGILYSWLKHNLAGDSRHEMNYAEMNRLAAQAPAGSQGLCILPYGNGAERTLENLDPGASIHGLNFNIHRKEHLLRAAQEAIVYALDLGLSIMKDMGIGIRAIRAGNANLFLSDLFCEIFASVTGAVVQLYNTDNAQGAARGAGVGAGIYGHYEEAFSRLSQVRTVEPDSAAVPVYRESIERWKEILNRELEKGIEP